MRKALLAEQYKVEMKNKIVQLEGETTDLKRQIEELKVILHFFSFISKQCCRFWSLSLVCNRRSVTRRRRKKQKGERWRRRSIKRRCNP